MDINNQPDYGLDLGNSYEFNEAEVRVDINDVGPSSPIAPSLQLSHPLYPGSSMIVASRLLLILYIQTHQ